MLCDLITTMCQCKKCGLHKTRQHVVPGRGDVHAPLWFVGEAPGKDEDKTGSAFVGRAGRLLDLCLNQTKITSFNIVNILKCRPPDNRNPEFNEYNICTRTWLVLQIKMYNPHVILAMGRFSIGFFRGYSWDTILKMSVTKEVNKSPFKTPAGRIVISTFHPAYLLRSPEATLDFIHQLYLAKNFVTTQQT